jgi:EpsI family protein
VFAAFPRSIGGWNAREVPLDPDVVRSLKATDYYMGDFTEAGQRSPVNLFVAYYDALSKGAAIHSPRVCLPAAGWEFASLEERKFNELQPGVPGAFNRVVVENGRQRILMYYWYRQRERQTANEFWMKIYLLWDSLRIGRSDGAIVRLYTSVEAGPRGMEAADERIRAFARTALPTLDGYFPK